MGRVGGRFDIFACQSLLRVSILYSFGSSHLESSFAEHISIALSYVVEVYLYAPCKIDGHKPR